jgi:molybdopterin-containing oxidoreductase family iron-sulfur binding subunit
MELPVISSQGNHTTSPAREGGTCAGHHSGEKTRLGGSLALPSRQWKSVEQWENSAKFQRRVANEFPPGALDEPDGVSRRTLLKMMSAAVATAAVTNGCERKVPETIVPYVRQPEGLVPGQPKFYATAMTLGGYAQGVIATSREGRPVKLEGNPDHPANHGSSNIFLQASLLDLYDPDRSQAVTHVGNVNNWDGFVGAFRAHLARSKNGGIAILTETITSPAILDQIRKLKGKFSGARWFVHDALSRENLHEGLRQATGRAAEARYDFGKANVIASFDCDFLFDEPGHLRYAGDFASERRIRRDTKTMNRLYMVESSVSITGTMADHRRAVRPAEVARHVHDLVDAVSNPGGAGDRWIGALADDLVANKGKSLVVAGAAHLPDVHAAAHSINQTLGNVDQTVHYARLITGQPDGSLRDLLEEMRSGAIECLFILGGNPAYKAPVDCSFADALEAFSKQHDRNFSVRMGHYEDETSVRCQWHLPESHYLESWSDARAYDGAVSLVQPLIDPLYATRSTVEVLDLLNGGFLRSGYEILREFWHSKHNGPDFESIWRRSMEKGVWLGTFKDDTAAQSENASGSTKANAATQPASATQSAATTEPLAYDLVFRPDPNVWDGTFTNNAFLQELMKPLTKLTWDNAALVSPASAKALGVADGDMLRISAGGREMEIPALVTPGHPDRTITLHLGYGRTRGGSVGTGVGFNTYVLRTSANPWFVEGAKVERTEGHHPLVITREHQTIESRRVGNMDAHVTQRPGDESVDNRRLVRVATMQQFLEDPEFVKKLEEAEIPKPLTLYPGFDHIYENNLSWGMSIDLQSCIGCNACIIGCQAENNIPVVGKEEVARGREMHWIRVDTYYEGDPEVPGGTFHQPMPCMQCENAPCELVCPVGATVHDNEGINNMVYNRCVGTRYCSNNCPYKVRRFNFFHYNDTQTESLKLMRNPEVTVRSRGVMEKCTYCIQRIVAMRREIEILQVQMDDEARNAASPEEAQAIQKKSAQQRQKILDNLQTACQQACPTQAIVFGNINAKLDPIHDFEPGHLSQVAQLKKEPLDYSLLADLNTKPRTTYLARIQNPNPALAVEAHTA